jgi:HEPN domain-containing protein
VEDAEVFIRDGRYDSAVDRIHTAFHGYLRAVLDEHNVDYQPTDSLTSLYNKLHTCYETIIQPADVSARVKTILRSAGGMVQSVNELRNNNTIAHPNGQLIEKREAQLVIKLVNAVMDYIETVEADITLEDGKEQCSQP